MKFNLIALIVFFCIVKSLAQTPELCVPAAHIADDFVFSKDDKIMVSMGQNEIKVWHTEGGGPYLIKTIPFRINDGAYNKHIYLTPDNKKLIVSLNGRIKILNLETFQWTKNEWKTEEPRMEGISQDGKTWYYFTLNEKSVATLYKLDLETGKSSKLTTHTPEDAMSFGGDLYISPDETLLISSSDLSGVMVDLKTYKVLHTFKGGQQALFINAQGNLITCTQVKTGDEDKDTYGANRPFKIEEINPRTMKTVRNMTVVTKSDDISGYNGIVQISHNQKDKIAFVIENYFQTANTDDFTQTKRKQVKFSNTGYSPNMNRLSNGGKFIFWNDFATAFKTDDVTKPYHFGIKPYEPFMLSDASKGNDLKAVVGDRIVQFDTRGLSFTPLPKAKFFDFHSSYRYLPSQKRVFMEGVQLKEGDGDSQLYVYDLKNDTSIYQGVSFGQLHYDVCAMREYDSLNTIVLLSNDRLFLMDTRNFKVKQQILYGSGYYTTINVAQSDDDHICTLSSDRTKIVISLLKEERSADNNILVCYDVVNKTKLWEYDGISMTSNPVYTEGGKKITVFNDKKQCITLDAETGKKVNSTINVPEATNQSFFSPTQKYVVNQTFNEDADFGGISNYDIYDIAAKKAVLKLPRPRVPYLGLIFMSNDRYVLSQDEDLKLWDLQTGKLLARIVTFENSKDWIMLSPDGRFDGSEGGLKQLYYVKGREIIPLEQLYEGFYTPGLMKQVLAGTVSDVKKDIKDIKSPPSVKLTYEPSKVYKDLLLDGQVMDVTVEKSVVQVTAEANSVDGIIEEIRLYHNGKLVGNTTRNLVVEDEKNKTEKKVFDLELSEGENRIKVVAINAQRTESKPDEIIFKYKPKTPSPSTANANAITLHMIVIGINKYKNQKYNLNYATADATSFKEMVEKNGTGLFSKTNIVYIGDEKATKEGIVAELEKIKLLASPKDVFIFYYAGHGVVNQNKDFFLVPNDVTQLYGADDALAQKGLSANQLQQFSKEIKAQKQLFILDACQSAGALDQVMASRGAAEEKAIAQLARATGTHWLTASGSEQFASEFTQLGHGTFTYVLLEALSGKADKGGDKKITVKELDAYLQEQVPEVTAKYKGTPQYPASYGFGNDFPIGVVKN
jgi:WD40 repeat protein